MRGAPLRIALVLLALAAPAAALASTAAGQVSFPACPPGTPPLPVPVPKAQGSPASPERVVAGKPFSIRYETNLGVVVQDTLAPPGTSFAFNDPGGSEVSLTVPAAGPAQFTVRYWSIDAPRGAECTQSLTFTVNVEVGDLLVPRGGYAQSPSIFARVPRKGVLRGRETPVVGIVFICRETTASVPVVADLRVERNLRRRPSAASPGATMTVPDPCSRTPTTVLAPGARLRHASGETVTVEHRFRKGARYWLRITQADRVLFQLRYYVAFGRKFTMFVQPSWVIATEAAFEAARCRRLSRGDLRDPLGYQKYPIPPCPR
jgi:hypothetical protein